MWQVEALRLQLYLDKNEMDETIEKLTEMVDCSALAEQVRTLTLIKLIAEQILNLRTYDCDYDNVFDCCPP